MGFLVLKLLNLKSDLLLRTLSWTALVTATLQMLDQLGGRGIEQVIPHTLTSTQVLSQHIPYLISIYFTRIY